MAHMGTAIVPLSFFFFFFFFFFDFLETTAAVAGGDAATSPPSVGPNGGGGGSESNTVRREGRVEARSWKRSVSATTLGEGLSRMKPNQARAAYR